MVCLGTGWSQALIVLYLDTELTEHRLCCVWTQAHPAQTFCCVCNERRKRAEAEAGTGRQAAGVCSILLLVTGTEDCFMETHSSRVYIVSGT